MLTRHNGRRFLAVEGRQIREREQALEFDPTTNQITVLGGSRRDRAREDGIQAVVNILLSAQLAGQAHLTQNELKRRLKEANGIPHNDGKLLSINEVVSRGSVCRTEGPSRAFRYEAAGALSETAGAPNPT